MKKTITKSVFNITLEYYIKNELAKTIELGESTKEGLGKFWKLLKEQLATWDNGFVELPNYIAVGKCVKSVSNYDYFIYKVTETIKTEKI